MKEKNADEMFYELGYLCEEQKVLGCEEKFIVYNKRDMGGLDTIEFKTLTKHIEIKAIINMQELRAINKKVEELGWI